MSDGQSAPPPASQRPAFGQSAAAGQNSAPAQPASPQHPVAPQMHPYATGATQPGAEANSAAPGATHPGAPVAAPGPAPRVSTKRSRTKTPRTKPRSKFPIFAGSALAFVGLLGVSFGAGWFVAYNNPPAAEPGPAPTVIEVPVLDPLGATSLMPDVRGLAEADAMQALADAGIRVASVSVESKPAAGTPGLVIEQTPAFGTESPADVTITVSAAARVPQMIGLNVDDVVAELAVLGTGATRIGTYDPSKELGEIIAVEPAPGSPLPVEVTITVNVSPSSIFLSQLDSEGWGGCSSRTLIVGGNNSPNAVQCSASTSPTKTSWLIAGAADRFTATVGIPDGEDTAATATITLIVDGKPIKTLTLKWGETQEVDLAISGALKLEIETTTTGNRTSVGLVNPQLLGDPTSMQKLQQP